MEDRWEYSFDGSGSQGRRTDLICSGVEKSVREHLLVSPLIVLLDSTEQGRLRMCSQKTSVDVVELELSLDWRSLQNKVKE